MRVGNDNLFQSNIFAETIATLTDCTIEIIETTGAVGAAKAAGVGIGFYDSIEEAMKNVEILEVVKPNLAKANYEKAYENWETILKQLL
jgi:xylulokinase